MDPHPTQGSATKSLPCSGRAIDGSSLKLRPRPDGLTVQVIGPNGGMRAEIFIRDAASLQILARGFSEAAPADVIPIGRRR